MAWPHVATNNSKLEEKNSTQIEPDKAKKRPNSAEECEEPVNTHTL